MTSTERIRRALTQPGRCNLIELHLRPRRPVTRPPLARMNRIRELLDAQVPFNAVTLGRELGVSAKTIRRDVTFMRRQLGCRFIYDDVAHSYQGTGGVR